MAETGLDARPAPRLSALRFPLKREACSGLVQGLAIIPLPMRLRTLFLALALAALSAAPHAPAAGKAEAQSIQPIWVDPRHERREQSDRARVRPVREIIETVRQRFGGGPMGGPRLEQDGGRSFYVLNWRFPNEVVEEIRVDAESGQIYR